MNARKPATRSPTDLDGGSAAAWRSHSVVKRDLLHRQQIGAVPYFNCGLDSSTGTLNLYETRRSWPGR